MPSAARAPRRPWWTSFSSEEGQATVEAAVLLPVLLVCMALLVQPACLLYTRAVMQSTAAETCRLISTSPELTARDDLAYKSFVLRRLAAVPDVAVFHTGGWTIELEGSGSSHEAVVRISTSVKPLPFMGVLPALLGQTDSSGNVVLEVEVATATRPGWLEGGYSDWTSIWD